MRSPRVVLHAAVEIAAASVLLEEGVEIDEQGHSPGVEPGTQRPERTIVRRPGEPGESEGCSKELAALVEHAPTR
jgi:hypothetical protein